MKKKTKRALVTERSLKQFVKMLLEADVQPYEPRDETRRTGASIDAQVDEYLSEYESEARTMKTESYDFRSMTRRFLNEAEDDDDDASEGDLADDDSFTGTADEDAREPEEDPTMVSAQGDAPKLSTDDIDIESFANSVSRLIESADALLEFRNTIFRRAVNHLMAHYEEDAVTLFEEVMREDHGIDDEASVYDIEAQDNKAPPAIGAGPDLGGGGVGG